MVAILKVMDKNYSFHMSSQEKFLTMITATAKCGTPCIDTWPNV